MEFFRVSLICLVLLISFSNCHSQKENITTVNSLKCSAPARQRNLPGILVPKGHYPWHATIFKISESSSHYFCGGTLISSITVLTAAHCLYERSKKLSPDTIIVRLGVTKLYVDGEGHEVHMVIPHLSFNHYTNEHDIGIIRLKKDVEFTDFIRPACLTNENFNIVNVDGFIPLFGSTSSLNVAVMPGRSTDQCSETNGIFNYADPDYSFCAGNVNGTTFYGADTGGGLVFERSDRWYIRGIASISGITGFEKVHSTSFAVFTDIQSYYQWIIDRDLSGNFTASEYFANIGNNT